MIFFFWCHVLPGRNTTLCKPAASVCVTLKLTASRISQSHKWDPSVKLPSLFLSVVLQVFSFYKSIFYLCYMEVRIDFLFFFFIFSTGTRPQHDLENAIWQRRRKPAFLAVLIFVDNHYTFRTRITAAFQHFLHSERCPFLFHLF